MHHKSHRKSNFIKIAFLLFTLLFVGCGKTELYNNLLETEANEMIAILEQKGISADKSTGTEENTWKISVEKGRFSDATDILKNQGYPKVRFVSIGDVFQKTGLVSSPLEERVRFMYALSESIADTLTHINGVSTARVHIVIPENDPYSEKVVPSSAAVFLTYFPDANLEDYIRDIKILVTNAIEGLDYEKVSVSLFPAKFQETVSKNTEPFANILSIKVAPASVGRFWFIIGAFFLILGIAVCAAGFFFWKYHSSSHQ